MKGSFLAHTSCAVFGTDILRQFSLVEPTFFFVSYEQCEWVNQQICSLTVTPVTQVC